MLQIAPLMLMQSGLFFTSFLKTDGLGSMHILHHEEMIKASLGTLLMRLEHKGTLMPPPKSSQLSPPRASQHYGAGADPHLAGVRAAGQLAQHRPSLLGSMLGSRDAATYAAPVTRPVRDA